MSGTRYALVSGTIFAVISLLQLVRAVNQWPAQVGTWQLPLWPSWVACVVAAALAAWAFRTSRK